MVFLFVNDWLCVLFQIENQQNCSIVYSYFNASVWSE
jgi:hypothetical protein